MNLKQFFSIILLVTPSLVHAQNQTNSEIIFQKINEQVWNPFTETYGNNDPEGFLSIHSHDLLRVPRDSRRISDYAEYYSRMKAWFNNEKSAGRTRSISFRFIERFHNNRNASEVGIFKVLSNVGTDDEKEFFGKFHVLLLNENGVWKILMDSDSSEGGTIGAEDFEKGFKMNDLDPFLNY